MQWSAGRPWVPEFMWMPLPLINHPPKHRCSQSTSLHGNGTPWWQRSTPQPDNGPYPHHKKMLRSQTGLQIPNAIKHLWHKSDQWRPPLATHTTGHPKRSCVYTLTGQSKDWSSETPHMPHMHYLIWTSSGDQVAALSSLSHSSGSTWVICQYPAGATTAIGNSAATVFGWEVCIKWHPSGCLDPTLLCKTLHCNTWSVWCTSPVSPFNVLADQRTWYTTGDLEYCKCSYMRVSPGKA